MLVDSLKIGGKDHARAVIPVSAISVVAGARNHRLTFAEARAAVPTRGRLTTGFPFAMVPA
jgi:hypothetical protein